MNKQEEMRGLVILQTIFKTARTQAQILTDSEDSNIKNVANELVDSLEIAIAKVSVHVTELEREGYINPYL